MNFQQPILTAAEIARLDTWAVEIAEEARGLRARCRVKAIGGSATGRSLIVHPGASTFFHDFRCRSGRPRSAGVDQVPAQLRRNRRGQVGAGMAAPIIRARDVSRMSSTMTTKTWLARPTDAQRIAEIETLWEHRQAPENTPVEVYLASRDLAASCELQLKSWLPNLPAPARER